MPYNLRLMYLLLPSLRYWLPEGCLASLASDLFDQLVLSAIERVHEREERECPPYHPIMMENVLLYAECAGVRLSKAIAKRLEEDAAFRVAGSGNTPSFRTVAESRSRRLKKAAGLFVRF